MPRPLKKDSCNTCRQRKVKCTQEAPVCQQCEKSGRFCDRTQRPAQFVHHGTESQSPREILLDPEIAFLFDNYIAEIAPWYDLSDSALTFGIEIPLLALDEPLVFCGIMALSAVHAWKTKGKKYRKLATLYHQQCVHLLITLNQESELVAKGTALATTCLLRSYELLDGDTDPNIHLQGAYSIASLHDTIDLESKSLLTAGFWNYLREDITYCLFEKCPLKMELDSFPPLRLHETDTDYLNSISLILGKLINIAFRRPLTCEEWDQSYKAASEWFQSCPRRLAPYSRKPTTIGTGNPLPLAYFLQASHGSAMHYYLITLAILCSNLPEERECDLLKRADPFQRDIASKPDLLEAYALDICGIAFSSKLDTVLVNTFGPIAYTGPFIREEPARHELERQLLACKQTIGWPVERLITDLRSSWTLGVGLS